MIHEALLLEYSARHLALMEWAAALKLFNYACIGVAVFIPWGMRQPCSVEFGRVDRALSVKLLFAGAGLALIETLSAKLRVFRAAGVSWRLLSCLRCSGCSCGCCWES